MGKGVKKYFWISLVMIGIMTSCSDRSAKKEESGYLPVQGRFLGEGKPGNEPQLFGRNVFSSFHDVSDITFQADGRELFFTATQNDRQVLMFTGEVKDHWLVPDVFIHSGQYNDRQPCFVPFRKAFYFVSDRPREKNAAAADEDIWYTYETMEGWDPPHHLEAGINTPMDEFSPAVTREGALYFIRGDDHAAGGSVYRAKIKEGAFEVPEKLSGMINETGDITGVSVTPDESVMVLSKASLHGEEMNEYLISFRDDDDTWSVPAPMGNRFGFQGLQGSVRFTSGGQYCFFIAAAQDTTGSAVYWVTSAALNRIK
jgi:hypothetical protein